MRVRGEVLADVRRAILSGFEQTPNDLQLAVDEASIGKVWTNITFNIRGLDASVDAVVQYAAQQGQLIRLLTTLADNYNPSLGRRLRELAQELKPLGDHAAVFGVEIQELESIVLGDVDFQDAGLWTERLGVIRRAVCRVEPQPPSRSIAGFGTGFLVEPNVVMTCNHVAETFWSDPMARDRVVFRFDYERLSDGSIAAGEEYRLADDWQILASPVPDFALLRVRPARHDATPRQPIRISSQAITSDRPLLILQHPSAQPLKLLFGEVGAAEGDRLSYRINTEGGSSGSPCLASDLRAVAVHYLAGNRAYTVGAICSKVDQALKGADLSADNRDVMAQLVAKAAGGAEAVRVQDASMQDGSQSSSRPGASRDHSPPPAPRQTPGSVSPERLAELTAHARRSIAAAAQKWLDTECSPFVIPSLSRQRTDREHHGILSGRHGDQILVGRDVR